MTLSTQVRALATAVTLALTLAACAPKDADIKAEIDQAISDVRGATVEVVDGVATMTGEFADEASRAAAEARVRAVKGVKSVVNNATVTPPVVIDEDESLRTNVNAALTGYPNLTATVDDGVVTLTGEVRRADLPKVMQALNALNPKRIDNKATVR